MAAAMDVLGCLPGPPTKHNCGAADALAGEVFAYGVAAAIAVLDVHRMKLATVLQGPHRGSQVSAVAWCPHHQPRDLPGAGSALRLASGDADGRVAVWDVLSGAVTGALEDPLGVATGRRTEGERRTGVVALAWLCAAPALLGIALAGGMFVLWDPRGGGVVWKKDFSGGGSERLASIQVDPLDRRVLCLCGTKGSLTVLRLVQPTKDRVEQQQYCVDVSDSKQEAATVQCHFSRSRDLMFVLLPRELALFDLELQQPAASTKLSASRPAFRSILGSCGHEGAGDGPTDGGVDLVYCLHQDTSLSVWRRQRGELTYTSLCYHKLAPPPSRLSSNAAISLLSAAACLWRPAASSASDQGDGDAPRHVSRQTACGLPVRPRKHVKAMSDDAGTADFLGLDDAENDPGLANRQSASNSDPASRVAQAAAGADGQTVSVDDVNRQEMLLMLVTDSGLVWQWSVAVPPLSALPPPMAAGAGALAARMLKPRLMGLASFLPAMVTTFAVCPAPLAVEPDAARQLPGSSHSGRGGDAVSVVAAVTAAGAVELITLRRGALSPLTATVTASIGAHKDSVRGVRWLGTSSRLVTFSSERVGDGWRNSLLLTDIRNRASAPFREVGIESAPMLGIRASPTGRHVLVLLRAAPSEIWGVAEGAKPLRLRVLDLPFTAVEWALPGDAPTLTAGTEDRWLSFARSPLAREWASFTGSLEDMDDPSETPPAAVEYPDERLAFALGDGRVGVLSVCGRKVTDTKPKRPSAGILDSGDVIATAVASWANFVIFGDANGTLMRWDTGSGRMTTVATGHGAVRRIHFAPPPSPELEFNPMARADLVARVSVLFASGLFGVWELDARSDLRPGPVTTAGGQRLGRVIDMSWAPLPHPIGGGSAIAVATDDGAIALVDVAQTSEQSSRRQRHTAFRSLLGGTWPYPMGTLSPPPALGSALLLPPPWAQLLRLFLQQGLSLQTLRRLLDPPPTVEHQDAGLERELWAALPAGCRGAWEGRPPPSSELQQQPLSAIRRRVSDSDVVDFVDDSFPPEAPDLLTETDLFGGLSLVPPPLRQSASGADVSGLDSSASAPARRLSLRGPEATPRQDGVSRRLTDLLAAAVPGHLSLATVARVLARMRAGGELLRPEEWRCYSVALGEGGTAARFAAAAAVVGCTEEVRFWRLLPATLALLLAGAANPQHGSTLWNSNAIKAEARERVAWHEQMALSGEVTEKQQERRLMEYMALGDYQTAVGFLLAAPPERSARYYRDALCTLALAAAAVTGDTAGSSDGGGRASAAAATESASRTLLVQAAKVVTANAASVGDTLLGVPLLCAAGLPAQAVGVLQDGGLWRYGATLTASALAPAHAAAALERWAGHVQTAEGSLWRAAALLVAGGQLRAAAAALRESGAADAAHGLTAACREACAVAGLVEQASPLEDVWDLYNPRSSLAGGPRHGPPGDSASVDEQLDDELQGDDDFLQHVIRMLHAL